MNATAVRLKELEARFERFIVDQQDLKRQVASLNNQLQALQGQGGNGQGGGSGPTFVVQAPSAPISANGGSISGETVSVCLNTALVTVSTNATIYNWMGAATVASNTLVVGPNSDGTYTAISQSC